MFCICGVYGRAGISKHMSVARALVAWEFLQDNAHKHKVTCSNYNIEKFFSLANFNQKSGFALMWCLVARGQIPAVMDQASRLYSLLINLFSYMHW